MTFRPPVGKKEASYHIAAVFGGTGTIRPLRNVPIRSLPVRYVPVRYFPEFLRPLTFHPRTSHNQQHSANAWIGWHLS
jgi:hypothetical protein